MTHFIQTLISGLSLGSIYALIALGYTMVYGIAKMLNFAHGDVIMVGGYISFCAMFYLGLPNIVAVLLAVIVRGSEIIIPEGSSFLREEDSVIIISRGSGITDLNDIYDDDSGFVSPVGGAGE